jgi:bacillithiol biosynthesis cysteine-adding enzyme BshC
MEGFSVDRNKTFYHNEFLEAYYYTDSLNHLRTYKPELVEISKAMDAKKSFPANYRDSLVDELNTQYKQCNIACEGASKVFQNIESLRSERTYTITTGQQIHIGLGPLYVLYKILDTLAVARECKEIYPEYDFVPVFWMASEDHDLDEIRTMPIYGKHITWQTDQKGAVGRMTTNGIPAMFEQIRAEFNLDESQVEFVDLCTKAYTDNKTLAQGFRQILHHYFHESGLVILDADSEILKSEFTKVLADELQHKNYKNLEASTKAMEDAGFQRQLVIRKCNLFKLQSNDRIKLEGYTKPDISEYVAKNAVNLSPNAALRPLYQEWILPNLVYVGGPSEVYYWSQLKGLFDNYKLPVPLLHLRTSCVLVPDKWLNALEPADYKSYYLQDAALISLLSKSQANVVNELEAKFTQIVQGIEDYTVDVKGVLEGFDVSSKTAKIERSLESVRALVSERWVQQNSTNSMLHKVLKTKSKYFNDELIQERNEHIIAHAAILKSDILAHLSHFGLKNSKKTTIFKTRV